MDKDLPLSPGTEEALIGLTELEPSPFEEKEDSTPSSPSDTLPPPILSRTSTLGLGQHGPAYYLLRIQRYSSYTFTVFAALHITNTSIIPLLTNSVPASEPYLLLTRPLYQSPALEPLLVALPLLAHITSGIALRLYRRRLYLRRYGAETRRDRRSIPWPHISGTSMLGFAFLPMMAFHIFTTRLLPLYMHGDSANIGLGYISHGFVHYPAISFAGFTAMVSIGVWHTTLGWAKWMGWTPETVKGANAVVRKKRRWYTINGISAIVTGLWLAGGLGVIGKGGKTEGWVGKEFDELYRHVPLLGRGI